MSGEVTSLIPKQPVIKVLATIAQPSYSAPWNASTLNSCSGSGVVIEHDGEKLILTAAHCVADSSFLQVQKITSQNYKTVEVVAVCHESDLALLKCEDKSFFNDIKPAKLKNAIPKLRDKVVCVGYPVGGEELSITEGIVSRIEAQQYTHSLRTLLSLTIDAAINSGNSGGPVFETKSKKENKIIGIAFQALDGAENIGYVVPVNRINHFLNGFLKGSFEIPGLGVRTQKKYSKINYQVRRENDNLQQNNEDQSIENTSGIEGEGSGIRIRTVLAHNSCSQILKEGDILLSLNGIEIANDGIVNYKYNQEEVCKSDFRLLVHDFYVGDEIEIDFLRDGKLNKSVPVTLKPHKSLVSNELFDLKPKYFIFGGVVFVPLSRGLCEAFSDDYSWQEYAPAEICNVYNSGIITEDKTECVVLSAILTAESNVGYDWDVSDELVEKVNGSSVKNFDHFIELVESIQKPDSVVIELKNSMIVALDPESSESNEAILKRYQISKDRNVVN